MDVIINKELVTIIMPVYGVEKYIRQCLDSVCGQTYPNLEIIIVDDQSPDDSGPIADSYASKDKRIQVLHIKNRGAAGARNVALEHCHGQYVMFVDSDDWLERNAVEQMLQVMQAEGCDLVECQFQNEYMDHNEKQGMIKEKCVLSGGAFAAHMIHHWEDVLLWNKLIRKDAMADIRFVEGRCIDDEFYTYKVIMNCNRIAMIPDILYHYRLRKSSAMGNEKKERQRLNDQIDFVTQRYAPMKKHYPDLNGLLLSHLMEVLMSVMQRGSCYPDIFSRAKKELRKYAMLALLHPAVEQNMKRSIVYYLLHRRGSFLSCHPKMEHNQAQYFQ